ncbi:unnamed protein product [Peniophora sp. CBMAI 1063]|nr:unnamed protein product [Peniophora sp. CBMAI 1063]
MSLPNPASLHALLTHPQLASLLSNHPNDLKLSSSSSARIPHDWEEWWEWAGSYPGTSAEPAWKAVLRAYTSAIAKNGASTASIPEPLQELMSRVKESEVDRTPCSISVPVTPLRGMSPKKAHEVIRMTAYVKELLKTPELSGVRHVVDVGAGQDAAAPSKKNRRRAPSPTPQNARGTLTHKTVHITPGALDSTVSKWTTELGPADGPIPVFFVALHACGSLTPDIFRMFISRARRIRDASSWTPAGACIVGCCYNLMSSAHDFPLSTAYADLPNLSEAHLQLAAQMPARWLDSPTSRATAELAIRKIVYRALLDAHLPQTVKTSPLSISTTSENGTTRVYRPRGAPASGSTATTGSGTGALHRRLGKLPDGAYASFAHFLAVASERLGVLIEAPPEEDEWFKRAQSQVEVLHVLRCIMGPSIESAIVADRVVWLREALRGSCVDEVKQWEVELVGLFDQAAGSARNFAIAIR